MSTISVHRCRIVRTAKMGWRGTPTAKFDREDGYFLVDCWFDDGKQMMQIRSGTQSLDEAVTVQVAIGLAIEWFAEQMPSPIPVANEEAPE